ncbi:MAG TPA: DivIVA domain-containing protein [Ilumatobacteraceae bacterium]|nr:DivIVA domain-containing protein [Ilumatobacteraceae bacterium]
MAMSFVRPDPSSPASVADAAFGTGRRGFDQGEVRDFLRMVAAELGRLQERERFLERELRTAQANPDLASVQFDDQTLTRMLGEETARVLTTARESAVEIRQKAEQSAAQMLSEASDEAARMREEAEIEASRRRSDAAADAEAELAMAKQQGREMVNEARAYRERVLSELARRRELAREQIEQLLHGRDRLMQSFERARLVAVDVVAELQPLGEPDEYVNLSPTTGPVPVMVPNSPRPADKPVPTESIDERSPAEAEAEAEAEQSVGAQPVDLTVVDDTVVDDTVVDDTVEFALADDQVDDGDDDGDGDGAIVDVEVADEADEVVDDGDEADSLDDTESSVDVHDDVVVDLFARLRADASLTAVDDEPSDAGASDDESAEAADQTADQTSDDRPADQAGMDEVSDESATDGDVSVEVTPFEQRDADLTPLIVASAKKLKRVLADEQNEVLDALRRREPVRGLADLLPPPAEHLGRYRVAVVDDLLAAANAGASLVTPRRVARMKKADTNSALAAGEAVLDEWLIVPLRERLERCVIDGGGDNAGITQRIRAVYREWKTQHIDEQLDDVFRAAHGSGVLAAIEHGVTVEWVSDPSNVVCADCNDNTLGGTVSAGFAFPTGHVSPPAHHGCRCLLLPADR